jgi:apolipoprotein N-acyltransferase
VAAGALLALSLPPWGWWPLALAGAALLLGAWHEAPFSRRLLLAAAAALVFHVIGLWWMTEFSVPGYVAATLAESAILALPLLLVPATGPGRFLAFPAALVVAQAVQGHWPFGGVPVDGIALGQVGGPLAPAARLGGHLLLVALVGAAGSAQVALAAPGPERPPQSAGLGPERPRQSGRWSRPRLAGLAGGLGIVLIAVVGALAPMGTPAGGMRVAAVQGGGVRGLRAVDAVPAEVLGAQFRASQRVQSPVDLVVWPEDVIEVDEGDAGAPEMQAMAELARELGATVIAGVIEDTPGGRFRNAAVAWGPDGTTVDRHEKVRRVPFGEYIPARSLIRRVADVSAVPDDAIAGRGPGVLDTPAGRVGVLISYEVFFADRGRAAVRAGGTVVLVPTNASSFTTSQMPGLEVAAARLRAIETGRSVVQAAPTGYSAVIDATGRVRTRSGLGSPAVLERTVEHRRGQTVATRLGDGPVTTAAVLGLALVAAVSWRTREKT